MLGKRFLEFNRRLNFPMYVQIRIAMHSPSLGPIATSQMASFFSYGIRAKGHCVGSTDGGYPDERCLSRAFFRSSGRSKFYEVRAMHEIINRRIEHFYVVSHCFRHRAHLQFFCFYAARNITELMLENGGPFVLHAPYS